MNADQITIFSDGSSRGNPGPGGYGYIAIYPNATGEMRVEEGGGKEKLTTNNRMELMAVIKAFEGFDVFYDKAQLAEKKFQVYLDSAYVLNGITKWVFGWAKKGWKTSLKEDVLNKDLWAQLMDATKGKNVDWKLLKGHAGIAGNERCDEIATGKVTELFKGKLSDYHFDPFNVTASGTGASSAKKNKGKKGEQAYSYVSHVDGLVMTHKTWEECEKRVKGAKGAKFKKALNAEEEAELIKNLGKV
jgi:ribonuclease HI